jgi:hypothetical protein
MAASFLVYVMHKPNAQCLLNTLPAVTLMKPLSLSTQHNSDNKERLFITWSLQRALAVFPVSYLQHYILIINLSENFT